MMPKENYKTDPNNLRHIIYPKTMKLQPYVEILEEKYNSVQEQQNKKEIEQKEEQIQNKKYFSMTQGELKLHQKKKSEVTHSNFLKKKE